MKKIKITPDKITKLTKDEVFVFGSNLLGNHAGGAALTAYKNFGAETGVGEGLTGQSYAFPTLCENMNKRIMDDLFGSTIKLYETVKSNSKKHFYITEVGCGIAGYSALEIAPLFKDFQALENVSLPLSFLEIIGIKGYKGFHKGLVCGDVGGSKRKEYAENTLFEEEIEPNTCSTGMHFCPEPLDVFNHYEPVYGAEYAEVVSVGSTSIDNDKVATNKLKIKSKISITGLFKAQFDMVKETVKKAVLQIPAEDTHANTAGNYAHANTAGYKAHANTAGESAHANTAGESAHANTAGKHAIACSLGIQSTAKASKGWIVLVEYRLKDGEWNINEIYRAKVGKHKIKGVLIEPDVKYWFENGELKFER